MSVAKARDALIYGECGGYMALGESLTDADDATHKMLGFLPVSTNFARRKLHLGYRLLKPLAGVPWKAGLMGHEFHYASISASHGEPLFGARNSMRETLPDMGQVQGRTCGSFAHVISEAAE